MVLSSKQQQQQQRQRPSSKRLRFGIFGMSMFGIGFGCGRLSATVPLYDGGSCIRLDNGRIDQPTTIAATTTTISTNLEIDEHQRRQQKVIIEEQQQQQEQQQQEQQQQEEETRIIQERLQWYNDYNRQQHPLCRLLASSPPTTVRINNATTTTTFMVGGSIVPSAISLWMSYMEDIVTASQLPQDKTYKLKYGTLQLLHLISSRLPLSTKSVVRYWSTIDEIMYRIYHRYQYLKLHHQDPNQQTSIQPPQTTTQPIKILVMGGSVTMGINCETGLSNTNHNNCSWLYRMEKMINTFIWNRLGWNNTKRHDVDDDDTYKLVKVVRVAAGGTNSELGTTILNYDILPEQSKHPDIIINAYSTNDMHIIAMEQAQANNQTLHDLTFEVLQNYIRTGLSLTNDVPDDCSSSSQRTTNATTSTSSTSFSSSSTTTTSSPLIVHLNDYLGNEQNEIVNTMTLNSVMSILSNYYGIMSISYADMVRDLVYSDTKEFWFSPRGWYKKSNYQREIHPSRQAHQTIAYSIVYNILNLITTRCNILQQQPSLHDAHAAAGPNRSSNKQTTKNDDTTSYLLGKPKDVPHYALPPKLTKDLSLQHISDLWWKDEEEQKAINMKRRARFLDGRNATRESNDDQSSSCSATSTSTRCPFAWVYGTQHRRTFPSWIESYFQPYIQVLDHWSLESGNKVGYIPDYGISADQNLFELEFNNFQQPVTSVTIFYMKSYGEKWKDSTVQVNISTTSSPSTVTSSNKDYATTIRGLSSSSLPPSSSSSSSSYYNKLSSIDLMGYHSKQTSETYLETIELLSTVPIGELLRITFQLIKGNTFKIMGLAICR